MEMTKMDMLYISCVVFLLPAVITATPEVKPEVVTTANDYYGYMNQFNGFKCYATGTNLTYSWHHNGAFIHDRYFLKFRKLNASILEPLPNNINRSYEGVYQCFVRNSIGTVFGRKLTVQFTIVGDFEESKDLPPRIVDVIVGRVFFLHCPKHAFSQKVKYNWYYKEANVSVALPPAENYFMLNNGTLIFSFVLQKDIDFINNKGGILCQQSARPKWAPSLAKESRRVVLKKIGEDVFPEETQPAVLASSPINPVKNGAEQLVLYCGAVGYPFPNLKWYRRKKDSLYGTEIEVEIKTGGDYVLSQFNRTLTIKNIVANKTGLYSCWATNNYLGRKAMAARNFWVRLEENQQWTTDIIDVEPALGSNLIWLCGASGGRSYKWYRNGVEIPFRCPKVYVDIEKNNMSSLFIENITPEYNGMYQCTSGDEPNIIYTTGRLLVKEPPETTSSARTSSTASGSELANATHVGLIVGIVIGVLFLLVIVGVVVYWYKSKANRESHIILDENVAP